MIKGFISTRQLAERWGLKINTLADWRWAGKGPKPIPSTDWAVFYTLKEVETYEKANPWLLERGAKTGKKFLAKK